MNFSDSNSSCYPPDLRSARTCETIYLMIWRSTADDTSNSPRNPRRLGNNSPRNPRTFSFGSNISLFSGSNSISSLWRRTSLLPHPHPRLLSCVLYRTGMCLYVSVWLCRWNAISVPYDEYRTARYPNVIYSKKKHDLNQSLIIRPLWLNCLVYFTKFPPKRAREEE